MTRGKKNESIDEKLSKDDIEHFMSNDLYIPTRTVYIGPCSEDDHETNAIMAERAIKNLHILDSKSDDPIEILMLNYGGEVTAGMAIYDAIQICQSHVTIKVFGCANSMGSIILQAADKRLLAPNAELMIHYGESGYESNHPKNIRAQVKRSDEFDKWMKEMYMDRMNEVRDDDEAITMRKIDTLLNFDKYFTPEQAVEEGLADGIIETHKKSD